MDGRLKLIAKVSRAVLMFGWASVIILAIAFFITSPDRFTAASLASFIKSFETEIWLIYLAASALRGFTLLPSTPLVLAGTLLYPDQPLLVLTISLAGILISSSLIYYCSEALGFDEHFRRSNPRAMKLIRRRLEHPWGLAFIALWAFFPLVPTDAVCYVAGTIRMNFFRFITAVFVGEFVLCTIYIFSGGSLLKWLELV